jgi:hypothetical protein
MAFQYVNRRGDVYHLQLNGRRGGGVGYSFTRKKPAKPADQIPEGFEVHENPDNAQVFLRKIKPTSIRPVERELVETTIRKLAKVKNFIVEVDGDSLVVWLADTEGDSPDNSMEKVFGTGLFAAMMREQLKATLTSRARYSKMLRFTLVDEESRQFSAERWCFLGSIDDWFHLGGGSLGKLLKKLVPHLGQESFFELI